jgi:riboflavin kinase/FMN adenylyltransferase
MPPTGIFACRAEVGAHSYAAAVHWGPRPTFEDPVPILEAHLLGFTGDLYGEWVEILFLERLREVVRFGDAGELSQAMAEDLQRTAEIADAAVTLQMDESR